MATAPDPGETPDETPGQRFRVESGMWKTFGAVCARRGIPRAQRLIDFMRGDVRRYGTPAEQAAFAAGEQRMRDRRSRRRPEAG